MSKKSRVYTITVVALFTALLCILAPVAIPIGVVPVTLATMIIVLMVMIVGVKRGLLSIMIYMFLGCVGMPVFSGFQGGVHVLLGINGGYIAGYFIMALIGGGVAATFKYKTIPSIIGFVMGNVFLYLAGTIWYVIIAGKGVTAAVMICVVPFIIPDIINIITGVLVGKMFRKYFK